MQGDKLYVKIAGVTPAAPKPTPKPVEPATPPKLTVTDAILQIIAKHACTTAELQDRLWSMGFTSVSGSSVSALCCQWRDKGKVRKDSDLKWRLATTPEGE